MEYISTSHHLNVGRYVGPQAAQARPRWAMLSISGYDDTTSPHQTFQGMMYDADGFVSVGPITLKFGWD